MCHACPDLQPPAVVAEVLNVLLLAHGFLPSEGALHRQHVGGTHVHLPGPHRQVRAHHMGGVHLSQPHRCHHW